MIKAFFVYLLITIVIIFSVIASPPAATPADTLEYSILSYIRHGFYDSVESHSQTNKMMEFIESNFSEEYIYEEPVLLAYYGVLNALKAKHVFSPFSKISYLRSALRKLDEAAIDGATNLEVRFLRFSVLHNMPSFLGYRETLREDTDAVYELLVVDRKYTDMDLEMARDVIEFVIDSKRLSSDRQQEMELLAQRLVADEQLSLD
jgi:hypothetical protein